MKSKLDENLPDLVRQVLVDLLSTTSTPFLKKVYLLQMTYRFLPPAELKTAS